MIKIKGIKRIDILSERKSPSKPEETEVWCQEFEIFNKFQEALVKRFGEQTAATIVGQFQQSKVFKEYYYAD